MHAILAKNTMPKSNKAASENKMDHQHSTERADRPRMSVEWIAKGSGRVRLDGFYLVSNGKLGIGPFSSEEDARAVQMGLSMSQFQKARANTP
jgi:hypothetical protein